MSYHPYPQAPSFLVASGNRAEWVDPESMNPSLFPGGSFVEYWRRLNGEETEMRETLKWIAAAWWGGTAVAE